MDQRLKKWIKWLKVCKDEIQSLLVYRDIFLNVQKLIKKNKTIQKPSSFYRYLGDTYISHAVVMSSLKPTYQYDWMAIFDDPWRIPHKDIEPI
jgi:hypothetical protein